MIRKLEEKDRSITLKYLNQEPSFNIFIIGDIETFGFDKDFQIIYGEFENNELKSVLLFYNENVVYYSHKTYFNIAYLEIFEKHTFHYMSGKQELMELIHPLIGDDWSFKPMYFCKANAIEIDVEMKEDIRKVVTNEDLVDLYHLLIKIEEFGIGLQTVEDYISSAKKGLQMGMKLMVSKDGKTVSTVATTAETTTSAMVVGVATDPDYRKQGYASQLMVALMKEYFELKKKELCLFYDNPKAGKIYKRLGFKDMGMWVMMSDLR